MISSTKSDAFAVVGDRNMRNRTVQVYSFHNNSSDDIQIAFFFLLLCKGLFCEEERTIDGSAIDSVNGGFVE